MPIIKGLEWTFDTVAATYAKLRPGYVDELYRSLFAYCPLDSESRAVEVGIGGGQATPPVLETGCALTAVEYGEHFAEICREKFKEYPKFSVTVDKFENVEFEENAYDLVYSASAFHWVPEEIGYRKVYSMLKPGGVFARFANHPFRDKGKLEMNEDIQKLYAIYMNSTAGPTEYGEAQAEMRANIAAGYGFTDIRYELFQRTRTFTAKEYIMLLGTYSDHIAIEETRQKEFFDGIEAVINRHGGEITVYDTIDLELARKR